jgi:hypothetical protein
MSKIAIKKRFKPQGTTREKVTFINIYRNNYKLSKMCAVLNISPKTYIKYRNKEDHDYYDYLIIKKIFDENKCTTGALILLTILFIMNNIVICISTHIFYILFCLPS